MSLKTVKNRWVRAVMRRPPGKFRPDERIGAIAVLPGFESTTVCNFFLDFYLDR